MIFFSFLDMTLCMDLWRGAAIVEEIAVNKKEK